MRWTSSCCLAVALHTPLLYSTLPLMPSLASTRSAILSHSHSLSLPRSPLSHSISFSSSFAFRFSSVCPVLASPLHRSFTSQSTSQPNSHAHSAVTASSPSSSTAPASSHHYDLIVIGSGPSGQKCAINAAKMKKRVAIIDRRDMFGGCCIHSGTIPSKSLREAIMYLTGYRQRGFYGKGFIRRDDISSHDIMERVKKVEQWETATVLDQLYRNRIHTIHGMNRIESGTRIYSSDRLHYKYESIESISQRCFA